MFEPEIEHGEIACPRCGEPTEWKTEGSEIQVDCADCGRFSITAEELEQALDAYGQEEDR